MISGTGMSFKQLQALFIATQAADPGARAMVFKLLPDFRELYNDLVDQKMSSTNVPRDTDLITVTLPRYVWRPVLDAVIAYGHRCFKRSLARSPPNGSANMDKLYCESMTSASEIVGNAISSDKRFKLTEHATG